MFTNVFYVRRRISPPKYCHILQFIFSHSSVVAIRAEPPTMSRKRIISCVLYSGLVRAQFFSQLGRHLNLAGKHLPSESGSSPLYLRDALTFLYSSHFQHIPSRFGLDEHSIICPWRLHGPLHKDAFVLRKYHNSFPFAFLSFHSKRCVRTLNSWLMFPHDRRPSPTPAGYLLLRIEFSRGMSAPAPRSTSLFSRVV